MSKYIDAVIAAEKISENHNIPLSELVDTFAEIPSADVVEVVRCKDCLYAMKKYGHIECINGVSYRNCWNQPDDYCRYGERADMRGDKR